MNNKRILFADIGDYNRDPMIFHKVDYNPFGWGSTSWIVFYFKWKSPRNKTRLYESYGRTVDEARLGLERATKKTNFVEISKDWAKEKYPIEWKKLKNR